MKQEHIITFDDLMHDTLWTGIIMTLLLGGFGLLFIIYAIRNKVIFTKQELINKSGQTNLQIFLSGIALLSVSFWHNVYHGYLFKYIKEIQLFFESTNLDCVKISIINFYPILLGFSIFFVLFGGAFSKGYADKDKNMYILQFNKFDKFFGLIPLIMIFMVLYKAYFINSKSSELTILTTLVISSILILFGIVCSLFFLKTKVLFNDVIIEFHTFWRPKRTISWKDVKKLTYEDINRQNMILVTKDNIKYKISTRFSGLTSFISTYKIRNKK